MREPLAEHVEHTTQLRHACRGAQVTNRHAGTNFDFSSQLPHKQVTEFPTVLLEEGLRGGDAAKQPSESQPTAHSHKARRQNQRSPRRANAKTTHS